MIFFTLVGLMAVGDVCWGWRAWLRLRRRWLQITAATFAAAMLAGLAVMLLSRGVLADFNDAMPRWVHGVILAWHLVILLPWLLWRGSMDFARLVSALARKISHVERREPAAADGDARAGCKPTLLSRREFFGAAAVFTPPFLSVGAAALGETQLDDFRIRRIEVPLADLPPALDGLTIANVSDVHVGRFTRGAVLERIAAATNALDADVITLTGDLINDSLRAMPPALEMVRALRAPHIFACEGNHDLIEDPLRFYREAERGGLPLLRDETATITLRGQRVQLLGLPWTGGARGLRERVAALLEKRDPSAWPLLLAHHPHAWDFADGIPLTLAGHTHGGQLMLNERLGVGPMMFRYWSGLYVRKDRALVVSNGVGNWFPLRLGAPAEIIHVTLRRVV